MAKPDDDILTPQDMRDWLQQELRDLTKALELRVKDATDFVTAYAVGEITAEAAMSRLDEYQSRWFEPIPGVKSDNGMPDTEILRKNATERLNPARLRKGEDRGRS